MDLITNTKAIDMDKDENTKPNYNKKSLIWTDTKGSGLRFKIRTFFSDIRDFYQRGKYGYCRSDVWDIDNWFLLIMPRMLNDLIEGHMGYPGTTDVPTDEDWVKILKDMKYYFEEANETTCSQKNEFEDAFNIDSVEREENGKHYYEMKVDNEENWENYKRRETEIALYQQEMMKKGIELFTKYFHYLWD